MGNTMNMVEIATNVQAQLVDVRSIYATSRAFAALKADSSVITWGDRLRGGDSKKVQQQLVDVLSIYATEGAFAALRADGSIVTWGFSGGTEGQEAARRKATAHKN